MTRTETIKRHEEKIASLEKQILVYQADLETYQKSCEQYAQAYDSLHHQIKELQRHQFGKKSERFIDPENPQLCLFEDNAHKFSEANKSSEKPRVTT